MQVTSSLQSQARKYLEYAFCENFSKNQTSVSVLENLSSNPKNLFKKEVHMRYLKEIPCLRQNFANKFLERVSLLFKEKSYGQGETIIDQFELKQPTLQIVMEGKVSLEVKQKYSQAENKFQKLKKYQYFGQISTLLYLELDDFLQLLDEFPDDKEVYYSLKDQLNLYQLYGIISQQCISCKTQGHLINRCRFISYQPNQLKVISKYVLEEEKQIKLVQRQQKKKHNILQSLNQIKQQKISYKIAVLKMNHSFKMKMKTLITNKALNKVEAEQSELLIKSNIDNHKHRLLPLRQAKITKDHLRDRFWYPNKSQITALTKNMILIKV
ncbi:hypothetical protein ABPG72_015305 [Tetrahymena utriculariae]